jgi:hypothetical protein
MLAFNTHTHTKFVIRKYARLRRGRPGTANNYY